MPLRNEDQRDRAAVRSRATEELRRVDQYLARLEREKHDKSLPPDKKRQVKADLKVYQGMQGQLTRMIHANAE